MSYAMIDAEWDLEWSDDDHALPQPPEPGELRIIAMLDEPLRLARFVGVADVDYSPAEPDVGWRGGPAVLWTFRTASGRVLEVSPEEVVD